MFMLIIRLVLLLWRLRFRKSIGAGKSTEPFIGTLLIFRQQFIGDLLSEENVPDGGREDSHNDLAPARKAPKNL